MPGWCDWWLTRERWQIIHSRNKLYEVCVNENGHYSGEKFGWSQCVFCQEANAVTQKKKRRTLHRHRAIFCRENSRAQWSMLAHRTPHVICNWIVFIHITQRLPHKTTRYYSKRAVRKIYTFFFIVDDVVVVLLLFQTHLFRVIWNKCH